MDALHHVTLNSVKVNNDSDSYDINTLTDWFNGDATVLETQHGSLRVHVTGYKDGPALFTYHDIGQTPEECWLPFVNYNAAIELLKHFCIYHIESPGHHMTSNDTLMQSTYTSLSIDELTDQLYTVCNYFDVREIIGLGVGLGSNIFLRFAIRYPSNVRGLILIDAVGNAAGWSEWSLFNAAIYHMRMFGFSSYTLSLLQSRIFGQTASMRLPTLMKGFSDALIHMDVIAVSNLLKSWLNRTNIEKDIAKLKCRMLLVMGEESSNMESMLSLNSECNKKYVSYIKVDKCGPHVQLERPDVLSRSISLFMEGLGFPVGLIKQINIARS